jgi:hypothetical protein
MKYKIIKSYDILGISSATLCLVHCLIVPFLVFLPLNFFKSIWIDILFFSIALFATSKIFMSQSNKTVKLILGLSISIVFISIIIELLFNTHFEGMLIGGVGLIIGHYLNFKQLKS